MTVVEFANSLIEGLRQISPVIALIGFGMNLTFTGVKWAHETNMAFGTTIWICGFILLVIGAAIFDGAAYPSWLQAVISAILFLISIGVWFFSTPKTSDNKSTHP